MTKDNGCVGSYSVSGYTRGDGTQVSSYTRTCGAAHNSSSSSSSKTSTPKLDDEEKMKQRAELLYPTMKENKNLENDDKKIDNTNFSSETKLKTRLFITQKEGFDANAYKDTGGVWTIGYGHTKNVKQGDVVTRAQAEELFWEDFKEHVIPLEKVKVPLSENQKVALASFIFNVGPTAFKNSTLLKKLNNNDIKGAADEFDRWILDNGVIKKGLINRRKEEKELFLTPDD